MCVRVLPIEMPEPMFGMLRNPGRRKILQDYME